MFRIYYYISNFAEAKKLKENKNPLKRKIIAVIFLPIIILVWTIGWTLTQIGSERKIKETTKESHFNYPTFTENNKDTIISDVDDKEPEARYEQEVIA